MTLPCDVLLGVGTTAKVQMLEPGCVEDPTLYTVTIGTGGAAMSATTVPVTALPCFLQEGTVLDFGAVDAILTEDAAQAATTIKVRPLTGSLTAGLTAQTMALLTLLGGESVSLAQRDATVDTSSFESGIWSQNAIVGKEITVSWSGHYKIGDPAIDSVIFPAAFPLVDNPPRQGVYVELTYADGRYRKFVALVTNYTEGTEMRNKQTLSWDFVVQKAVSYGKNP